MSFADFPDEQQVVHLLQRSLDKGRLSHAYLFSGGSASVLETMAGALAKTINCQQPPRRGASGLPLDSCDQCLNCRKIAGENHADVQWVRPESKSRVITIDQIRDLMRTIYLKPTEAEYKIAVITAADRLNTQAANAFLKTLEEPPAKSVIILLSTDPQRVLETIISRCLRLTFAGESHGLMEQTHGEWLAEFSDTAAKEQKGLLSRYRLLGILLNRLAALKAETEKSLSARSPLEKYGDADTKLRDKWEEELTAAIEAEYRRQRSEVVLGLQWWLRDVWLQTQSLSQEAPAFPKFAQASETIAKRITPNEAAENLTVIDKTQRLLGTNVQEALALEVGLLKLKL